MRPISLADAMELYEMRLLLERACVERAVRAASDADIATLDRYAQAPAAASLESRVPYNGQFHRALAGICGSRRLERTACEVIQAFDRLTCASVGQFEHGRALQKFVDEHAAIIELIKKRDAGRASSLIRSHVENLRKRLFETLSSPSLVP